MNYNYNEKVLEHAIADVLTNALNYPDNVGAQVLGTNMSELIGLVKQAVIDTGIVELDNTMMERPKVTRVELVENSGRAYVKYGVSDVATSLQDEGRTLKLFLRST